MYLIDTVSLEKPNTMLDMFEVVMIEKWLVASKAHYGDLVQTDHLKRNWVIPKVPMVTGCIQGICLSASN